MIALSSKSCQKKQFPRVMRVWVLWRGGTIFCKDKIRALRLDVEDRFGSIVGVTYQCVPWLVRHATWLLNTFQRRQNDATAFENLKGVHERKERNVNLWTEPQPDLGVPKRMRIWSKHSRPLTPAVVSDHPEKRAKNPETLLR